MDAYLPLFDAIQDSPQALHVERILKDIPVGLHEYRKAWEFLHSLEEIERLESLEPEGHASAGIPSRQQQRARRIHPESRAEKGRRAHFLHDELLSLIAESRAAMLEQEAARAQFHSAVGKRQNLELRGVEMRSRIAAHLKAQLGFRNDQLREFGLNPLPRSTRRRPEEEPQVPPPVEDSANSAKPAEITVAES